MGAGHHSRKLVGRTRPRYTVRSSTSTRCTIHLDPRWRYDLAQRGKIRILGLDTPEVGSEARCTQELGLGRSATLRLQQILEFGPTVIQRHGVDK